MSHRQQSNQPTSSHSQQGKSMSDEPLAQLKLAIDGMSCQSCATRLEKTLNKKDAIETANINFASDTASVAYHADQSDVPQILKWVHQAGFEATVISTRASKQSGNQANKQSTNQATNQLGKQETLTDLTKSKPSSEALLANDLKNDLKHEPKNNKKNGKKHNKENNCASESAQTQRKMELSRHWRLIAMLICWLLFMIGMVGMLFGYGMDWMLPIWLQFVLATFVQFVLASSYYRSAWSSIKNGMANMDVLVVLGTLSIWLYSTFVWLFYHLLGNDKVAGFGEHVYFESSVMILAFVGFGKYLENRTKKQSLNSIDMMMSLVPSLVEKQSDTGEFYQADLQDIKIADVVRARQGSRIAVDGMVIEGNGYCNESHLTGESEVLFKDVGDKVLAGSLVENGSLVYRVYATGEDSKLADMIQALSEAQDSKAPIARLADKVAGVFIPVVIVIAILTFVLTYYFSQSIEMAVLHAVAVLVVACPCALGLATPAAIVAGMGLAARQGVLFKDAESLERAGQVDTVVLDKTGTLTEGRPSLVAHLLMDKSLQYAEVLQFAASVEAHASHPFATAFVAEAKNNKLRILPVTDVSVIAGQGVQGRVNGVGLVKVGSPSWLKFDMPADIAQRVPKVLQSSSLVAVSIEDVPLGLFAFADDIRKEAKATVKALKNLGLDVMLMSGDKAEVVSNVSELLNIDEYYAKMTPRNKAEKIKAMQNKGKKVVMVGDGVNDAPAMAVADASFAMLAGTDIAKQSASVQLLKGSLSKVVDASKTAKATVRIIKQNLFLAFAYNIIAIPLAALGYLTPMIAAAMMSLSSIFVLLNALRLNKMG